MAKPNERHKDLDVHFFITQKQFLAWLEKNYAQTESIWLKFAKKASGIKSINYEQAREAAIMYGWIDGLINGLDADFYLTKFTPRRPKSLWSQINRGIAESLIAEGRMQPSGLAQVEAAKADGRWQAAYASQANIEVPPELQKRLDQNPKAKKFFESITKSNRYAFLYRIHNAKRPETKQRHVEKAMEMLIAEKVYHPKLRKKK
ncbi:MAG: YdeI/OmpD-associated family protein [Planctomycetota bacterium]